MGKRLKDEEIYKLVKDLEDKLIIVEGRRDEEALKTLGLKNIIAIKGKPAHVIAEIASKSGMEIVILTDFDRKGRELNARIEFLLQRRRVHVNSKLRMKVMSLGKNKIEDLSNLREGDDHVKVSSYFNKIHHTRTYKRKRGCRKT